MHCWYCICRLFYACMKNVASQALSVGAFSARKSIYISGIIERSSLSTHPIPNSLCPSFFVLYQFSIAAVITSSLQCPCCFLSHDNRFENVSNTNLSEPISFRFGQHPLVPWVALRRRLSMGPGTLPSWTPPLSQTSWGDLRWIQWSLGLLAWANCSAVLCEHQSYCLYAAWKSESS